MTDTASQATTAITDVTVFTGGRWLPGRDVPLTGRSTDSGFVTGYSLRVTHVTPHP